MAEPGEPSGSFLEHFDGSELHTAWIAQPPEGVLVVDSEVVLELGGPEPCFLARETSFARSQLWVACARPEGPGVVPLLGLEAGATAARIVASASGERTGLAVELVQDGDVVATWSDPEGWGTGGGLALETLVRDQYLTVGLEVQVRGSERRLRFLAWSRATDEPTFDQGYRLFLVTDWAPWESVFDVEAAPHMVFGDTSGEDSDGTLAIEWVRFADGPRVDAWANGKERAQAAYDTRHWWSYDGDLFVPASGERPALPHGRKGEWDSHYAKDAWVVQDEDGLYYLFHSGKPRGGVYSIGVAFSANVDGPWIKYEGNPILTARPGTAEAGLQFPTVVVDSDNEDPDRRWQMLYDGYTADPIQHAIFLATAPHPLGPWTRRGRALGPGEPGSFDELGCAGGVPLFWEGRWEVWYPGLRRFGETGIWSVGRAVGASLDTLERDGFGPRVTQQAGGEGRVDGPMRGRFVPLDDTRGFRRDAVVLLTADHVKNNYTTSRIRRVREDGIELYHSVVGFGVSTLVRQFDRASLWPRRILRAGDEWWLYVNLFGTFRGAEGGVQTFDENTALLKHSGGAPTDDAFEFDWLANPPIARGVLNNDRSSENISLVSVPVRR